MELHEALARITGPFPDPIPGKEHPWNLKHIGKAGAEIVTYLERHGGMMEAFQKKILNKIMGIRAKTKKCVRIASVGPATGEEIATILGRSLMALREAGERENNWGIVVEGIQPNDELSEEATQRLIKFSPFVISEGIARSNATYRLRVKQLMEALNKNPIWTNGRWNLLKGDVTHQSIKALLQRQDVVFMNACGGGREFPNVARMARRAYIFMTESAGELAPITDTHAVENGPMDFLDLDYVVATPKQGIRKWPVRGRDN